MDPVALLNEIPDFIERCVRGYNFFQDVKDAPKACSELMKELQDTRDMLAELQAHVSGVKDKGKAAPLFASLQNYKTALVKLDAVLNEYRDPKSKFDLMARFKWVFSEEKKIKALCDDLKQNSGKFQPLLIQIARDIDEMNKRQQEADAKKAAEKQAKRLRKVVNWLEPLNSPGKLREVRERRQPETCDWLLSHDLFISWCKSTGSFLWLKGIPGNGKTILASSVIDYLEKNLKRPGENIVLFAFADFQDIRSTDVVKTMEQHHTDQPKSVQYLVELLGKASAPWKHVFIVIDALDECVQKNRRESIAAIRNLASAGFKISILVTSRVEQDIEDVLSSVSTISLVDETQRVKDDIARFIEIKMNKSYPSLTCLCEPVCERISSTLLEKANGMFCLVDCQLQLLAEVDFESDIDQILRNLPPDLNSMYERIFEKVKLKDQRAAKIVQHTLWWLVGSLQKLHLEEVMEAVIVETGRDSPNMDLKPLSGKHLLKMCSSLVHHDTKTDNLTLSHASVQDFLFSGYLKGTAHSDYHIPSFPFLHRHTTCLVSAYLQYRDFQNGLCTTPENLAKHLEQHPFLVYVISNWHLHAVKMYETCSEWGEQPLDIHTLFALSNDSEKSILAWCSCRQVSYFGKMLRYVMTDGSSRLLWDMDQWCEINHGDLLNVTEAKHKLLQDVGGFMVSKFCSGPSWLQFRYVYPGIITSMEELAFMVCSLISEEPASLVWDLLCELPQFKDHPLFNQRTSLMISISARKLDIVKMLLQDLHVNANTCALHYYYSDVVSPIFLATKEGDVEAVKLLLQYGSATKFPLECPPKAYYTLIESRNTLCDVVIRAVADGHADILQILICHGADVNAMSSVSSNTALHVAVRYGHIDSIKLLVEAGYNLSLHSNGKTPLDLALNQQSSDIVQYLLDKGASFDQCLSQNFEGLEWAVGEPWYPETQQYLVTPRGGSPNSQQDIEKIVCLLEKQLSSSLPHIIWAILDFAELWIVTSAE
ncbi:hypothetical protein IW262DRAFT_1452863 [Armillaria fumosa]|nr:hypothetical protein IW262DRAFT_1452863 [Armillaria fumosa]